MSERILAAIAAALAALILGLLLFWHPDPGGRPATPPNPLPAGGDFSLQGAAGPVALHDYAGRLVIVYFGYTFCPDICPTTLNALVEAKALLTPEERQKLAVLFVSLDPQRDTPAHLKTYLEFFDPDFAGVTGEASQIAEIAARYGVIYKLQPPGEGGNYAVDHSAETFLVGPDGRLRARLAHGTPPAQMAALIRQYLN
ncbi:SCO family protein [Azonexus sp.]|uniref:SCO family protein n=1 Tax=Azonexus sp. TaxID=1872668 RepID=UPI0035B37772